MPLEPTASTAPADAEATAATAASEAERAALRARPPLIRLLRYARGHRRTIALAAACSVANKVFDLAPPVLIGAAVDIVVRREGAALSALGPESPGAQLALLGAITLVIWVLESAFEYAYQLLWRNLAQRIQHELRIDAYGHAQRLALRYFEDEGTGSLLTVLGEDVNQLERFLDGGANALIQVATTVVVIGTIFFWIAPGVAWMAVAPMPLVLWASLRYQRVLAPRYARVRESAGELMRRLAQNIGGMSTIQGYATESRELERISALSERYRTDNRAAIQLSSLFSPLIRMVIVVGFLAALLGGGFAALDGRLEIGAYSVLVFMIQRLLWPLTRLGETLDLYRRAMASTSRALDVIDTEIAIPSGVERLAREGVRGVVAFEDIHFCYPGRAPLFAGLTLRVAEGETLAVVGSTGAGKSTLVKLLLRFYEPQRGRVTIDGRDVRALDLGDLRRAIGVVQQDVFLFDGAVRETIAYGSPHASPDAIARAAEVAEASAFVEALPLGYDTIVGERGQKLSGGQRQRLAIARTVLRDPPVLVFDEATSSVDNETEAAIQRSLYRLARGRTTIVIAHRLSTIRHADRIVVLEHGAIIEEGTHEALVERGGTYAALWRVQTGEAATIEAQAEAEVEGAAAR